MNNDEKNANDRSTDQLMKTNATINNKGEIIATFVRVANETFTAFQSGMSGYSYYAHYTLDMDALTATPSQAGTYLLSLKYKGDKLISYLTTTDRDFTTTLGENREEANSYKMVFYLLEGDYASESGVIDDNTVPEKFNLTEIDPIITISISSESVFEGAAAD